jgi:hypothetical protein
LIATYAAENRGRRREGETRGPTRVIAGAYVGIQRHQVESLRTVRAECLDWLPIFGPRQLDQL